MGFGNPLTVKVPVSTRDLWYWPAVQGESFPPSLSTATAYAAHNGGAAYSLAAAGGTVACPRVTRILPDGRRARLTFTRIAAVIDSNTSLTVGTGPTTDDGVRVQIQVGGASGTVATVVHTIAGAGAGGSIKQTAAVQVNVSARQLVANQRELGEATITYNRDGTVTSSLLGVARTWTAAEIAAAAPTAAVAADNLTAGLRPHALNNHATIVAYVGPVQVTYP